MLLTPGFLCYLVATQCHVHFFSNLKFSVSSFAASLGVRTQNISFESPDLGPIADSSVRIMAALLGYYILSIVFQRKMGM